MKRYKYWLLGSLVLIALGFWSFKSNSGFQYDPGEDADKDKLLIDLVNYTLQSDHYSPVKIDDRFSEDVYKRYLIRIDPLRLYFYQYQIDSLDKYKDKIDDLIRDKDLTFFNLSENMQRRNLDTTTQIIEEVLSKPFDFNQDENINLKYDEAPFAQDRAGMVEKWRKLLKQNVLERIIDTEKEEDEKVKEDATYQRKTFAQIEEESRNKVLENYKNRQRILKQIKRQDQMGYFLNTITEGYDPHTNYFAPRDKEVFDVEISGKFEGIGARLTDRNGYATIVEVIPGSPTWKNGEIEVDDKITKVAQGKNGEYVDIVGMRLDDAIELIKGKKGSQVKLYVKKVDGSNQEVILTRDVIELEETFAKSSIIQKDGKKFGIIHLPKFYVDFNSMFGQGRNAADDVAKELEKLKAENVSGIILDLRNNGGGSLGAVIKMAGLFIDKGPVVQVKSKDGEVEVFSDHQSGVVYDGPLAVMVNEYSASASEILAAALQDYNRAVIIGSKSTFGKGTVQRFLELDNIIKSQYDKFKPLGAVKVTEQKYYRINGKATQLVGVHSDVVLPDIYQYIETGEKNQDNAMAFDEIKSSEYKTWNHPINVSQLASLSKKRIENNPEFKLIDENASYLLKMQDSDTQSLNLEKRKQEIKQRESELDKFKKIDEFSNELNLSSTAVDLKMMENDTIEIEKRKVWFKAMNKDPYVLESINVLNDIAGH